MKLNFYIENEQVYDIKGNIIPENENGIVIVDIDGELRRFIRAKLVRWLEVNPEIRQAKVPKIKPPLSQYEAKVLGISPNITQKPIKARKIPKITKVKVEKIHKQRVEKQPKPPREKPLKVKKPMGRPRIFPRNELGQRLDKLPKGYKKHGGNYGFPRRKIKCVTNGVVYDSLYQAAQVLNLKRCAISHVLSGKYYQTKGFRFESYESER